MQFNLFHFTPKKGMHFGMFQAGGELSRRTVQANWLQSAYANWLPILKAYGTWLVQVMIVRFLFIH